MFKDGLDDVGVLVDTKLIRDCQEQSAIVAEPRRVSTAGRRRGALRIVMRHCAGVTRQQFKSDAISPQKHSAIWL